MRALALIALLPFLASVGTSHAASITRQDAVSRAQSAGYSLVSKAEPAAGSWDIWASKDGIAYEIKENDGSLIAAVPMDDND